MKLELVEKTGKSYIELLKNEKRLIGIKITDVTKDEEGPAIRKIKPESPVARSFAVALGDVVLSVNGQLTRGKRKKDVRRMIKDAASCVNLQLEYKIQEMRTSRCGVYRKRQMTTKLRKVNGSFGFVLRKEQCTDSCFCVEYPFVSNIKEGSQSHKNNQMQDGDRLISVDDLNVSWLSLDEIASILQDRDEAEFTFEYNIKLVNFSVSNEKLDLEIDVPVSDLGLSFCMDTDSTMYVSSIKMCSIAERCGVFCVGDIILFVNGIGTRFLTPSKADLLLRNTKKVRKISFISRRRKECSVINAPDHVEVFSIAGTEGDIAATESTSGIETTDWKHVNTPASSNIAFSMQQNYFSLKFCHTEQMEVIDRFQHIVPLISSLEHQLCRLTREACNARQGTASEICTSCTKTQHSLKLCSSCLTRMKAECEQSMEFLKRIIVQFVDFSTSTRSAVSPQSVIENEAGDEDVLENQSIKVSIRSVVVALTETLPKIFDRMPEFQKSFDALAEKVVNADKSCSTCEFEIKSVMVIVKKLLLLISLKDNSGEITELIERLVCCLFETKFTCDGKSEHTHYVVENECSVSVSENLDFVPDDRNSLSEDLNNPCNTPVNESSRAQNIIESIPDLQNLNMNTNLEYLKIVQSVSDSQNSVSGNEVRETEKDMTPLVETGDNFHEVNLESSSTFASSKVVVNGDDKNIHKDKALKLPRKVWKSLDSFLRPKKHAKIRSREQHPCSVTGSGEVNRRAFDTSSSVQQLSSDDNLVTTENISYSNDGSTRSSFRRDPDCGSHRTHRRVRSETVEVKMRNDGDGFGLGLSLRFVDDTASIIPVIHAVKSKSPSQRTGIIKVDDRVVAINHRSTLGLGAKQFHSLKNTAFLASSVILTIEFDVIDQEPKFGTFNVVLNRTLKTGLVFKEMKRGSPMVVAGVVKGSAAHRCGQLYAGDEITRFRCIRSEKFDSASCNYDRDEKVHMTVLRNNAEGHQKKSIDAFLGYVNPSFSYDDFVPRNGTNFVVKSSTIRAIRNSESLVYDQEVTLFRDLNSWDFGFLVGVDGDTGRAFVTDIRPDGPAHMSGVIKKYDRIVKVDGVLVDKREDTFVVGLLSEANHKVDLLIRRMYHEASKRFGTETV